MNQTLSPNKTSFLHRIHIDGWLLLGLLALMSVGLFTLYSASGQDQGQMTRQLIRLAISFVAMFVVAQIPTGAYRRLSPYAYVVGLLMLIAVLFSVIWGKEPSDGSI